MEKNVKTASTYHVPVLLKDNREINRYSLNDMADKNAKHYGLDGSPTRVQKIFPPTCDKVQETWTGSAEDLSERIYDALKKMKFTA